MKLGRLLGHGALVATALGVFTGTAKADPIIGGTLYKTGDVFVMYIGSDAAYTDDLYFYLTVGTEHQFLFSNAEMESTPGSEVDVDDSSLARGDEVIFGICVDVGGGDLSPDCGNADHTYYSGDPSRNPDGQDHIKIWSIEAYIAEQPLDSEGLPFVLQAQLEGYEYIIGFEDILGGGDLDFNDVIYAVRGTAVPEPLTMTLLATGLAGMGVVRRRSKKQ